MSNILRRSSNKNDIEECDTKECNIQECIVCQEKILGHMIKLKCNHFYCLNCFIQWYYVKQSETFCPMCHKKVFDYDTFCKINKNYEIIRIEHPKERIVRRLTLIELCTKRAYITVFICSFLFCFLFTIFTIFNHNATFRNIS